MIDAPWPLLDIYANPDDEDEYADLAPPAAAAEDAELAHFWSLVRAANPPPTPLPPGLQTKAFDPGKHPHGSHGRFVYTTGGKKSKLGVGPATVPAPSPPEHHLKTSKGTFTNALTWKTKLASVQGTFKDSSRAELEHAYAHHNQRLKTWQSGGSEDPVKDAAALHELRQEAERRGMHFDTAGHLNDARVPEIVVPKHQVLASTGVEHDKAHPGIYQIGRHDAQGMYADHSDQSLEAHYRAVDALLGKDHAEESPAQAYHAAHLHEMHLEAQRRGMHFDEQGNLIGKKTTGPPPKPKEEPKPAEPKPAAAAAVPEATHETPEHVKQSEHYQTIHQMVLEDSLPLSQRQLAHALEKGHTMLAAATTVQKQENAHAVIDAVHEVAAHKGWYVGTDGNIHDQSEKPASGGVPEAKHEVPQKYLNDPKWEKSVATSRDAIKDESVGQLEEWLGQNHDYLANGGGSEKGNAASHAIITAIHQETAARGMYVGTDGKLHPKQEAAAAAAAKPEAPKTGPQPGGTAPPPKPKGTKLTQEHAREIRGLRLQGWTHGQLVEHYGSSKGVINNILTYKSHREGPVAPGEKATLHHAREIRYRAEKEHLIQKQLAAEYGITDKQVWHILHGTTLKEPGGAAAPAKPKGGNAPKTEQKGATEVKPDLKAYLGRVAKVVESFKPGVLGETMAASTSHPNQVLFNEHQAAVAKALGISEYAVQSHIAQMVSDRTGGKLSVSDVLDYRGAWNQWPTEKLARAAQWAIREKFNLQGEAISHLSLQGLSETDKQRARMFVDAHYAVFQEVMAKAGITEMHLVRGVSFGSHEKIPGGMKSAVKGQDHAMLYNERVLSSWGTSNYIADNFAKGGVAGYVIGATVPVSRVFGVGWDGMGTTGEYEYVLIGGDLAAAARRHH